MTYSAPPVVYPLGRSRFQAWLLAGLWGAGALSTLFWVYLGHPPDWHVGLACVALLVAAYVAFAGWKNAATGQLVWDGQSWRWVGQGYQSGIAEQTLSVMADFQHLLLLRIESPTETGNGMCIWSERGAFPERWLDFRRAVFSPGRHPGGPDAVAVSGHAETGWTPLKP